MCKLHNRAGFRTTSFKIITVNANNICLCRYGVDDHACVHDYACDRAHACDDVHVCGRAHACDHDHAHGDDDADELLLFLPLSAF